jgi:hypothetical protein
MEGPENSQHVHASGSAAVTTRNFEENLFCPDEGVFVLQVQVAVIDFLVKLCEALLDDRPGCAVAADSAAALEQSTLYSTLLNVAVQALYSLPPRLEFSKTRTIVSANLFD